MKLAKPSIPAVYVQARDRDGKSAGVTLYDTTPEEVIDLLRSNASPSVDSAARGDVPPPRGSAATPNSTAPNADSQEK